MVKLWDFLLLSSGWCSGGVVEKGKKDKKGVYDMDVLK